MCSLGLEASEIVGTGASSECVLMSASAENEAAVSCSLHLPSSKSQFPVMPCLCAHMCVHMDVPAQRPESLDTGFVFVLEWVLP